MPYHTVKKVTDFPLPRRNVTEQTLWPGIIKFFPARECLVSDILAGDGKIGNFLNSSICQSVFESMQVGYPPGKDYKNIYGVT